ncbi:DUF6325 family protein [Gordonia sp. OPL2]|uniref:DUF6325 family protein n=1 Tax=Gordonia sp. OPL2 TaxID=2486274 RepID=UPI001CA3ADE5|nr:DUF6325 family protein [Gordonia sp. OPL2]
MTTSSGLGPIDYVVVELPRRTTTFTDEMAGELASLVESGVMRVLDLLIIERDRDGTVDVTEFEDLTDAGLGILDGALAEILALEDVENLATAVAPGRCAAVIVWEYLCARPFAVAAHAAGAEVVAQGRIPTQAIVATLRSDPGQRP